MMSITPILRPTERITGALVVILLSGCATFSDDGGFNTVRTEVEQNLGISPQWSSDETSRIEAQEKISALLEGPITVDAAMQIALLNNPRLQAEYANLGISEADYVQAGRLPNPGFSFGKTSGGGGQEIERGLHFNIVAILTLPIRTGIEFRRFEASKLAAAMATVETALSARTAYYEAVAARQTTAYVREVVESAETSRDLMQQMSRVGNASRLDLAHEQLFHAEAIASLEQATLSEYAARESLIRILGLWGEQTDFSIPERLPDLPAAPKEQIGVEKKALAQRFDVRRARAALDALSSNLGLTKATRFVNVLEAGPAQVRERGEPTRDGYEVSLEIPIFDFGGARVHRAEAMYQQASELLRSTAITARSQVRQSYRTYRATYNIAKHYRDEVVPLRKKISEEQLLRYNGMLISIFELISDARAQVATVRTYLDALRAFWVADSTLQAAMLVGASPGMTPGLASVPQDNSAAAH